MVAHAQHRRLDRVEPLVRELPEHARAVLAGSPDRPPAPFVDFPVCGALLLALAMVDLDRGRAGDEHAARSGVRLVALAERFQYLRNFQPTMSAERAREAARHAAGPAYADAVSAYAGLTPGELRPAALAVLADRQAAGSRLNSAFAQT
ncbi:hypothetical protein B0I33_108276 [Prauserella shujinwangii]|uniref:Uncharacterized protein n=1 Tax=Prauserella shujinwangii TaxID=1453103 RepID=A0A2T0LRK2_9PSEU|nr:hypothetical protein B0I33_108276 [Prauserella shujinwangii]